MFGGQNHHFIVLTNYWNCILPRTTCADLLRRNAAFFFFVHARDGERG